MKAFRLNHDRLRKSFDELAQFGCDVETGGISRPAFSSTDLEARNWLKRSAVSSGLLVDEDGVGNIFVRLPEAPRSAPKVLLGSHIDTVPNGGKFDGALGVLVALEILRSFKEQDEDLNFFPEAVSFSDEEGRYGLMLGSQAYAGKLSSSQIATAQDTEGRALVEKLSKIGYSEKGVLEAACLDKPKAFFELHIEQGPVLHRANIPVGIVSGIVGLLRYDIRVIGRADHAGTTPLKERIDAFRGLMQLYSQLDSFIETLASKDTVYTTGQVSISPGAANVVPERVECSLDIRDPNQDVLDTIQERLPNFLGSAIQTTGCQVESTLYSRIEAVQCDTNLQNILSGSAKLLGYPSLALPSGAAHDAQQLASLCPTAMLFVPSVDGRSHSPLEQTNWEDIVKGADVFATAIRTFCKST